MKTYSIYIRNDGVLQAVKSGFSWPAFFFTWLWALSKGMVALGAGLLVLLLFVSFLDDVAASSDSAAGHFAVTAVILTVCIVTGASANGFWRERLKRKGYEFKQMFEASSATAALDVFRKAHPEAEGPADVVECPRCNTMIPPGESKCPKCGWE